MYQHNICWAQVSGSSSSTHVHTVEDLPFFLCNSNLVVEPAEVSFGWCWGALKQTNNVPSASRSTRLFLPVLSYTRQPCTSHAATTTMLLELQREHAPASCQPGK
jgi:hypothetical protein